MWFPFGTSVPDITMQLFRRAPDFTQTPSQTTLPSIRTDGSITHPAPITERTTRAPFPNLTDESITTDRLLPRADSSLDWALR